MNPFDYGKVFTDFWAAGSQALMKAQEQATQAMTGGLQAMAAGAMPGLPGLPGLPADLAAGTADLARANQAMIDLWSAAGTLSTSLAAQLHVGEGDATVEATFHKLLDPRSWMSGGGMNDVLGRMASGPRFADMWDVERRYARVGQGWMDVRRRALEHNAVLLEAWLRAGQAFTAELAMQTSAKAQPPDPKAMLALWTETANKVLLETQRSDGFLSTQNAMIRATTELRLAQQDLVEHYGKQFGFPTRTELDDVHRSVTEMRRELRAIRRELKEREAPALLTQTTPTQAAPTQATPAQATPTQAVATKTVPTRQRGSR